MLSFTLSKQGAIAALIVKLEDDRRWDEAFYRSPDVLAKLAASAMAEYQARRVLPTTDVTLQQIRNLWNEDATRSQVIINVESNLKQTIRVQISIVGINQYAIGITNVTIGSEVGVFSSRITCSRESLPFMLRLAVNRIIWLD